MKTTIWKNAFAMTLVALTLAACFPLMAEEPGTEAKVPVMKDDPTWKLDFSSAELIAVQQGQRKKPLQTYAFESIEQIVGRPLMGSTFIKVPTGEKDEKGEPKVVKLGAMDLYLSIWFFKEYWDDKPLILVTNNELRKRLAPATPAAGAGVWADDKRMSARDLANGPLFEILRELKQKTDKATQEGKTYEATGPEAEAQLILRRMEMLRQIQDSDDSLALVPHPTDTQGTWISLLKLNNDMSQTALGKMAYTSAASQKTIEAYFAFRNAYKARNAEAFKEASMTLRDSLVSLSPSIYPSDTKLETEIKYNNMRPFALAWIFYICASVLALAAISMKDSGVAAIEVKRLFSTTRVTGTALYVGAMALYLIGLGLHIYGFALRCYIAGRPPVSNMYESVVWVGFGAVFFGLIFELIYKKRYYVLAGSFAGFLCLALMDLVPVMAGNTQLAGFEGDIKPLQPVLRDNFWLTVHVLTITLSYAAFMLAWGMGHISLMSHLVRPTERVEHRELHTLVYRVMQIGVLLLATGTILGGVWAYYSWGRFWGWDPKETWAFIALMCYIVVLHGRFAGLWTNFGLAFGSVFCFQAIVMAWYGVNFVLGSGKHSYGSGGGGKEIVLTCVGIDMLFLAASTWQYLAYKKDIRIIPYQIVAGGFAVFGFGWLSDQYGGKIAQAISIGGWWSRVTSVPPALMGIGAVVFVVGVIGCVVIALKNFRVPAGLDGSAPDLEGEDQSARGRVEDVPNQARDPHVKFG